MQTPIELLIENLLFSPFFFLILGILLLVWPTKNQKEKTSKLSRILFLWVLFFVLSSSLFFQLFSWPLKSWTPVSQKQKADVIVVATAGIHKSGAPSPGSTIRAHAAAQLYLEGWAPLVLVTGGVTHPYNFPVEAKGMNIILKGMGIPDDNIILEVKSTDTFTNSTMSARILNRRGLKKILLVTHDYHMLRLSSVFEKLGFEIIPYSANESFKGLDFWWQYISWNNFNRLRTYAHEYIGLIEYKIRGWI